MNITVLMRMVACPNREVLMVRFYKSALNGNRQLLGPSIMVALTVFVVAVSVSVSFFFPALALPQGRVVVPLNDASKVLCQCSLPFKQFLCPLSGPVATNRPTPLGTAQGIVDPSGAYRFSVKYASAPRWGASTIVSAWGLPYVHFCQEVFAS